MSVFSLFCRFCAAPYPGQVSVKARLTDSEKLIQLLKTTVEEMNPGSADNQLA